MQFRTAAGPSRKSCKLVFLRHFLHIVRSKAGMWVNAKEPEPRIRRSLQGTAVCHRPVREGAIMSNRKGFAAVAACAALACAGLARASDVTAPSASDSSAFTLVNPIFAADSAPRKPLMALLDKAGAGATLDQYGLNVGGFVEAGWTYNFQTPDDQVNYGRVFDVE